MPHVVNIIPSSETAAREANKPFLVGSNLLGKHFQTWPQWRTSGSWASGADFSDYDANCPWFAADNCGDAFSAPLASVVGQEEVSLLFWTHAIDFDTVLLWNHNFDELGSTLVVEYDIADNQDFSDSFTLIRWEASEGSFASKARHLGFGDSDFGALRVTDALYHRLRLRYSDSETFPVTPRIGEVWAGRRRQLSYASDEPWDPDHYSSDVEIHRPEGGAQTRDGKNPGGKIIEIETLADGPDTNGHDQSPEILAWYEDVRLGCEFGTEPCLVVLNGATYEDAITYVAYPEPEFQLPYAVAQQRISVMRFEEIAPYRARGF